MTDLPRLSKLEVQIMDLLLAKPVEGKYGAQIIAEGVAEGSTYTTLARMVDKGLVESYRDEPESGPKRRYFKLTAHGKYSIAVHHRMAEVAAAVAGEFGVAL